MNVRTEFSFDAREKTSSHVTFKSAEGKGETLRVDKVDDFIRG